MNLLGIDFEDWYHPELIQQYLPTKKYTPSVINGIDKILDFLRKNETYATFFMVGELLEFKPELLDKILGGGHEIAFHTMRHTRLDFPGFREKFTDELKYFHELTKGKSKGFRAPTFSLNMTSFWAIDMLSENKYECDSSTVPAKTSMYGMPNAEKYPYKISSLSLERNDPKSKITEFPILTTNILGKTIPTGGGFYLRVLPQKIIHSSIEKYEHDNIPATFYIHSWELVPEFMKKINLPLKDHFITYHNLSKSLFRLEKIIKKFKFTSFNKYVSK